MHSPQTNLPVNVSTKLSNGPPKSACAFSRLELVTFGDYFSWRSDTNKESTYRKQPSLVHSNSDIQYIIATIVTYIQFMVLGLIY